ncbi:hypothetical protein P167DRAFT_513661 [Morchella conica CCBAS932]|uniref:Uncharacterized protein n=1 Tax=Morchella conica CCBAS932 TaxID=1392247 RepID=A0A3N4KDE3_9PEZI|nr:hypothetical protein P167DRAFT_513661 [Morchella conica CCBAS932]
MMHDRVFKMESCLYSSISVHHPAAYRQNSKNWLSRSRDYHLSDWLNGIDLL